jgi:hypothetical protein
MRLGNSLFFALWEMKWGKAQGEKNMMRVDIALQSGASID